MDLSQALAAFLAHPSSQGALVLCAVAFVYGIVKFTAAATRGAVALEGVRYEIVGIRQDFSGAREEQRAEHVKTREEVQSVRDEVVEIKARYDRQEAVAAAAGNLPRRMPSRS